MCTRVCARVCNSVGAYVRLAMNVNREWVLTGYNNVLYHF